MQKLSMFFVGASAAMLISCDGVFESIYDEAPADVSGNESFAVLGADKTNLQLSLDATAYDAWHYIDLHKLTVEKQLIPSSLTSNHDGHSGITYHLVEGDRYTKLSEIKTDSQPEPDSWDFAIHHFDVKTNGGEVLRTEYTSLKQLPASSDFFKDKQFTKDVWSDHHVIIDLLDMMAFRIGYQNSYVNEVLSGWVTMDLSNPPPTFSSSGKVYLLRLADGSMAALHLLSYMSKAGTKGHLTIDIRYPY